MKRIVKLLKNCVGRGRITQALLTRKCMSTLEMVWKRGKNCTASFNWNVYLNVLLNASAQKADFIMALFKELFFEMFYEQNLRGYAKIYVWQVSHSILKKYKEQPSLHIQDLSIFQ